ncbi:hypothetical protein ACFQH2_03975 [Natronoarchaeum sp. GCM10025703]
MTGNTVEDVETLSVVVDGETVSDSGADWSDSADGLRSQSSLYIAADGSGSYLTDDRASISGSPEALTAGTEISVIWNSADTNSSATLFEYEVEKR